MGTSLLRTSKSSEKLLKILLRWENVFFSDLYLICHPNPPIYNFQKSENSQREHMCHAVNGVPKICFRYLISRRSWAIHIVNTYFHAVNMGGSRDSRRLGSVLESHTSSVLKLLFLEKNHAI